MNYLKLNRDAIDKPVYRIMPAKRLFQCLNLKQLVLVPPKKWDDPFENWLLSSKVKLSSTGAQGDMLGMRKEVFGQCWTLHRETDAMWRIYSSDNNGARIKTTPRKLLEALKKHVGNYSEISCFIGKVEYKTQKDLVSALKGIDLFNTNGSGIAESLLYKRREFSHEREVRLIYTKGNGDTFPFHIGNRQLSPS
jgi:hypothetical protein